MGGVLKMFCFLVEFYFFIGMFFCEEKGFYHGMCYRFVIFIIVIFYYKELN